MQDLNTLLDENARNIGGDHTIWLADNYDNLPDYKGYTEPGTVSVDSSWRSPFIGKTIPDVVAIIRGAPKPPKPLNRRFCAVLNKETFDEGLILICKSLENESDSDGECKYEHEEVDVASEEEDGERLSNIATAKPGSIKEKLLRHDLKMFDKMLECTRMKPRSTKQALKEHGSDYDGVQVIPTDEDEVGQFSYYYDRRKWRENYVEWREKRVYI